MDELNSSYTGINDNEMFDDGLESLFSKDNFYANPMATKIYFNFGKDKETEVIGNAVVANLEEVNEKIPVYSYNSSTYQKYLQGKRIITGVIALRKVTIASFLNLIKRERKKEDFLVEENNLKQQIVDLKKIKDIDGRSPKGLIYMLESKLKVLTEAYRVSSSVDEYYINGETNQIASSDGKILEKDNLLYYIEMTGNDKKLGGNTAKFRIEFEGAFEKGPVTNINDVLFIKKQTEINIDKTDIFDVYSFIGNPDINFVDKNNSNSLLKIDDTSKISDFEIV